MYTYLLLDPRPQSRDAQLATLAERPTLGIEVTVPELAEACALGNIDPQHLGSRHLDGPLYSGEATVQAAITEALTWPCPPPGTQLATVRPDADSIGAMAVLAFRSTGRRSLGADALGRVADIAAADSGHSEWSPTSGKVKADDL
ncbi:MAG: hypothetical protein ACRCZP_09425, partial [Phycicoccus sp.]